MWPLFGDFIAFRRTPIQKCASPAHPASVRLQTKYTYSWHCVQFPAHGFGCARPVRVEPVWHGLEAASPEISALRAAIAS